MSTRKVCRWTEDDDGVYQTDCGEKYHFVWGGPVENKAKFCQYCGKPLQAKEVKAR